MSTHRANPTHNNEWFDIPNVQAPPPPQPPNPHLPDFSQLSLAQYSALSNALTQSPLYSSLNLNPLSAENVTTAQKALFEELFEQCSHLPSLDKNPTDLLRLTPVQREQLHSLDLRNIAFQQLSAEQFQALCNALSQCTQLGSLDLSNTRLCYLDPECFKQLCDALSECKQLHTLNITFNRLDDGHHQTLYQALAPLPQLVQLKGLYPDHELFTLLLKKNHSSQVMTFANALLTLRQTTALDLATLRILLRPDFPALRDKETIAITNSVSKIEKKRTEEQKNHIEALAIVRAQNTEPDIERSLTLIFSALKAPLVPPDSRNPTVNRNHNRP